MGIRRRIVEDSEFAQAADRILARQNKYHRDIYYHPECRLGCCMECRLQVDGHCTRPLTVQEAKDLRWDKEHRDGSKHELQSHEMEEIAAKEGGYWRTPPPKAF